MQSASAAIRALPAPDDDLLLPEPPTTLFTRHLPARPMSDDFVNRITRFKDYQHLRARLDTLLIQFKEHLDWHGMEAEAVAGVSEDGQGVKPYTADLSHAVHTIELLLNADTSAVPRRAERIAVQGQRP